MLPSLLTVPPSSSPSRPHRSSLCANIVYEMTETSPSFYDHRRSITDRGTFFAYFSGTRSVKHAQRAIRLQTAAANLEESANKWIVQVAGMDCRIARW